MASKSPHRWPFPGSRWWKFDFHSHTPASTDTLWAKQGSSLTPKEWLLEYMAAEIDCVAVTDHNTGKWIDKLQTAYNQMKAEFDNGDGHEGFRELTLFPGVEISVQGGIHLLAVFNPSANTSDVDQLLGRIEYQGTAGSSDGVTSIGAAKVVARVLESGAIPIPAHADRKKGLLALKDDDTRSARLDANSLVQVLKEPGIFAMEVLDPNEPKPQLYENHSPSWSEVLGSDWHGYTRDNSPGSRYTWVKMEMPSLEGLRLALLDGNGFSLRRSDEDGEFDPFRTPETFINRIEVEGARYMGNGKCEILEFTPFYNALVGGRGTGKSTIVQALRLAFHRGEEMTKLAEQSEVRRRFERFSKIARTRDEDGALRDSTIIRVTLWRDGRPHRLVWKADASGEVVEEMADNGDWQASDSQAVNADRFPIRIMSQGQIAAMASENRQALIDIIDEAAGISAIRSSLKDGTREFLSLRAGIRVIEDRLAKQPELARRLSDLESKLKAYKELSYADVLKAHQIALRQQREVDSALKHLRSISGRIGALTTDFQLDDWPNDLFDVNRDADILKWRATIEHVLARLGKELTDAAARFDDIVTTLGTDADLQLWDQRVKGANSAYLELKKKLPSEKDSGPTAFGRIEQERQKIEAQIRECDESENQLEELQAKSEQLLERLRDLRRQITERRAGFVNDTLHTNRFVRIEVVRYGYDERVYEREIRELIDAVDERFEKDILSYENGPPDSGLAYKLAKATDREAAVEELKETIIQIDSTLGGHFRNFLQRKLQKPEFADRVRCWFPEDDLKIKYRRGSEDWARITEGSQGQRSAALLAFLLAFGDAPLVLDQPEDDLDNHLIYDLIVRQIRENKLRRQLLIVTHNPNVVVNGDAEMIHALDFKQGQCRVIEKGALQDTSVREEVCLVMEGGREAFERRWVRLGKNPTNV